MMFTKFFTSSKPTADINSKPTAVIKNELNFNEDCQYVNLSNDRLIVVEDNSCKIFSIIDFKQILEIQCDSFHTVEAIAPDNSILFSVENGNGKNLIKFSPNLKINSTSSDTFDDSLKCFFINNSYIYAISSKNKILYIFQEEKETSSIKVIKRFSLPVQHNEIILKVEKLESNQFYCEVMNNEKNELRFLVFVALPDEERYEFLTIDDQTFGNKIRLLANGELLTYNKYGNSKKCTELMIWNSKTGVCTNKLDLSQFSELKTGFLTIIPAPDPGYLVIDIEESLRNKLYLFHINDSVLKEIVFPSNVNFNAEGSCSYHLLGNGQFLRIMDEQSKQIHFDLKEMIHYRKTMFDKLILCHYALSSKGKLPWDVINLIFSAGIISTPVNQYFDDKNMMLLENQEEEKEEETNSFCLMM